MHLRRPDWLTFEWAIPLIWTTILICGVWSAVLVWQARPSVGLMLAYGLLEVSIMAYTAVMGRFRRLRVGVWIGAIGVVWGAVLALRVWPISGTAAALLLPYLLWSPVGTWVTWEMMAINPADA
jgi:tryptophan-rich sensory protein